LELNLQQPSTYLGMDDRARRVSHVLWLTLVLNWLIAALKIVIGFLSGRTTVLADGFHSLLDGTNNVVALIAIRHAAEPPDEEHPYGHRKFENLAAMFIGGLVVLLAWETLKQIVTAGVRQWHGSPGAIQQHAHDWIYIAAIAASLLVNVGVAWYEKRAGVRLASPLLTADAAHTNSDALVTGMGLISLLVGHFAWWIDPLLALAVVGFLLSAAWHILDDNIHAFTDRKRLEPADVRSVAQGVTGVLNAHAIRSHGTINDIHLDLHVVVAEHLTAAETADIEQRVDTALRSAFPGVTQISIQHQTHDPDPHAPVWAD
jgi:cation diffusion facilitator family transporter